MSELRDERLTELIREIAAEYINLESNRNSLITITRVDLTDRGRRALIHFTVLPDSGEEAALDFLDRHRSKFRKFFSDKKIMGFPPQFKFALDLGEKNRQRIDELSNQEN